MVSLAMAKLRLRSCSFRNVILEENLLTESLNDQTIFLDHTISNDLKPEWITTTAKLIVAVEASRLKYDQAKIEKAEKKLKEWKQLEIITKEIIQLKTKVDSLKKVNKQLDEESETFLFDADANPSKASYFIAKTTALKSRRNENKDEIKVLEEAVEISEKKRSKVNKWHFKWHLIRQWVSLNFSELIGSLYIIVDIMFITLNIQFSYFVIF